LKIYKEQIMTKEELEVLTKGTTIEDCSYYQFEDILKVINQIYDDFKPDCSTCKHTSVMEYKEPCASCYGLNITHNNWKPAT